MCAPPRTAKTLSMDLLDFVTVTGLLKYLPQTSCEDTNNTQAIKTIDFIVRGIVKVDLINESPLCQGKSS